MTAADIDDVVSTVISTAVRHVGRDTPGTRPFSCEDVITADHDGLLGSVHHEVAAGRLELGSPERVMLDTIYAGATSEAVLLEARAATAVEMLRDRGIDCRVLKGVASAHLDYPIGGLRQFGDIDLLVRGPDMAAAVAAFARLGFSRHFREPFDGFDARIGKGVAVGDSTGVVVDLHRTLALGYFGTRLPVDELWADPTPFEIGGVTMHGLSDPHRFVHCALHLALAPTPTIANSVDLVMIGRREADLDAEVILAVAEGWGCELPLAIAVDQTTTLFGAAWAPPGLAEWSRAHRPSLGERVAMSTFHGRLSSSRLRSATAVLGLRSRSDRMLAARGLVARGHHERE